MDRTLLAEMQRDATLSYAALGAAVGLSAGAAHERVRKLRQRGVIRRTTIDVDPESVGRGVLAYVMIKSSSWMGDPSTRDALTTLPEVEEAHIIAGAATVLLKVRTGGTRELQAALRRLFEVDGVTGTETIVVLETLFERPVDPGT